MGHNRQRKLVGIVLLSLLVIASLLPFLYGLEIDSYNEANQDDKWYLRDNHPSDSGNISAAGQTFNISGSNYKITSVKFYLQKVQNPTGNGRATLWAHTGTFGTNGKPTGSALATSDTVDISTIDTSFELVTLNFTGGQQYEMVSGTQYCIVFEMPGTGTVDTTNYLDFGLDVSSPSHEGNAFYYVNGDWGGEGEGFDAVFYVYGDVVVDNTAPTYSSPNTNTTTATNATKFQVTLADEIALDFLIFGTNNTGTWVNETSVDISGTSYIANTTKILNETIGIRVEWRYWFNDTSDNWNDTGIQFLIVIPVPVTIDVDNPRWGMYNMTYVPVNLTTTGPVSVVWYNILNGSNWVYVTNQTYTVPTSATGLVSGNDYTFYGWVNSTLDSTEPSETVEFMNDLNAFVADNGTALGIQTAIDLATVAEGGNVTIPAGTWNFTDGFPAWPTVNITSEVSIFGFPNKRVTGETEPGVGRSPNDQVVEWATVLNMTYEVPMVDIDTQTHWFDIDDDGNKNETFRFSDVKFVGYRFHNTSSETMYIGLYLDDLMDFRIDHNNFQDVCGSAIWIGGSPNDYYNNDTFRGVVDHNILNNTYGDPGYALYENTTVGYGIGMRRWATNYWEPNVIDVVGNYKNYTIVIEDNYFTKWRHGTCTNDGISQIVRHNTWEGSYAKGDVDAHGSYADEGAPYAGGTRSVEVSYNLFMNPDTTWYNEPMAINHRGGAGIFFNNTLEDYYALMHLNNDWGNYEPYRPDCFIADTYIWNNTLNGAIFIGYNSDNTEDVDYFLRAPNLAQDGWEYKEYEYPSPIVSRTSIPPVWRSLSSNTTIYNTTVLLSSYWEDYDGVPSQYAIEHNNSGIYVNVTGAVSSGWANTTFTLNDTVGVIVVWSVYVNGSEWAQTHLMGIMTTEGGWTGIVMGVTNPSKIMGIEVADISKVNEIS